MFAAAHFHPGSCNGLTFAVFSVGQNIGTLWSYFFVLSELHQQTLTRQVNTDGKLP
jgi:hypothetical protein